MIQSPNPRHQAGFTLVEVIVSIVVVAVAMTGALLAMQFAMRHSADPMIRQQQVAIAEAYMEEIMLRKYDPDTVHTSSCTGSRYGFQYVNEYESCDDRKARTQGGDLLNGLSQYSVTVEVDRNESLRGRSAAKINVKVDHGATNAFTLTGYKTPH